MSTYTPSLGLEEITPGDQAGLWGNTTNNNLVLIDQAVTGVTPIDFTGLSSTVKTLTTFDGAVDEARAAVLNISGIATGSNTVVVPNKQKMYLVRNATGQDVIFRTASPTTTYTVGAGNSILIFCNGNNEVFTGIASPSVGTLGVAGGGTGSTTFTAGFVKSTGGTNALTSSAAVNLASEVSGVLTVDKGGTGAGTFTSGSLLIGNGTSNFGTLVGGGVGQVATWNGSTWTAATPTTGAVNSVTGSGNITASPTTGSVTVSISSTPSFTTVTASSSMTAPQFNVGSTSNPIFITGGGALGLGPNLGTVSNATAPLFNNVANLGAPGFLWAQVYAAVGTINTSDANEKTEIANLDEAEKRVARRIKGLIKKFKFKDAVVKKGSGGARIHVGVIAQEVGDAFRAEGLNPDRYSMFCFDQWDEIPATLNPDGSIKIPATPAGSSYGVRYEELLAFVIAAL